MSHRVRSVFLAAVLLPSVVFLLSGCGNEDVSDKLDTRLNRLVDAEKRGEAESYAAAHGIDLADGAVKVVIESLPGRLDAVITAAAKHGTVVGVTERAEHLSALVPVASLTALAGEEGIRFIRVPEMPTAN